MGGEGGGVQGQECFYVSPGCLHLATVVRFQACYDLASYVSDEALVARRILTNGDSLVHEPPRAHNNPRVLQDTHIISRLLGLGLENILVEVHK